MEKLKLPTLNRNVPLILDGEKKYEFNYTPEELDKLFPGSITWKHFIKYSWQEYLDIGSPKAESFYPGEYAICREVS